MEYKKLVDIVDVKELMEVYNNFHDSCIVRLDYESGSYVDEDFAMNFGSRDDHALRMVVDRQDEPKTIELVFKGVKQFNINGYEHNYVDLINEAFIEFNSLIINTYNKKEKIDVITWSTDREIYSISVNPLKANNHQYIVAKELKWRFISKD